MLTKSMTERSYLQQICTFNTYSMRALVGQIRSKASSRQRDSVDLSARSKNYGKLIQLGDRLDSP
jgi:hypothetical protein